MSQLQEGGQSFRAWRSELSNISSSTVISFTQFQSESHFLGCCLLLEDGAASPPLQVCFLICPRKLESVPLPCCPLRSAVAGKPPAFHSLTHLNNSNMSVIIGLVERFWTIWKRVVIIENGVNWQFKCNVFSWWAVFFIIHKKEVHKSRFWEGNRGLESYLWWVHPACSLPLLGALQLANACVAFLHELVGLLKQRPVLSVKNDFLSLADCRQKKRKTTKSQLDFNSWDAFNGRL